MTRRYTGAEALALKAAARPGPWGYAGPMLCEVVCLATGDGGVTSIVARAISAPDGSLIAAAPDLADSLAAVEAERDALRAYFDASQELSATRQAQRKEWERGEGPASYEADDAVQAARTALNDAREAALSALREAVPE